MAKITMTETPEWDVLPVDTIIRVKVDDVKIEDKEGKFGPWQRMSVKFIIEDVPASVENSEGFIGQPIWGSVPFKLNDSADNALRQWIEALLGMELSVGFELDTDELLGRRCRAVVSNYTSKEKLRHQVEALLPLAGQDAQQESQAQSTLSAWTSPQQPVSVPAAPQTEEFPF